LRQVPHIWAARAYSVTRPLISADIREALGADAGHPHQLLDPREALPHLRLQTVPVFDDFLRIGQPNARKPVGLFGAVGVEQDYPPPSCAFLTTLVTIPRDASRSDQIRI
jgi:hypothetical protein